MALIWLVRRIVANGRVPIREGHTTLFGAIIPLGDQIPWDGEDHAGRPIGSN